MDKRQLVAPSSPGDLVSLFRGFAWLVFVQALVESLRDDDLRRDARVQERECDGAMLQELDLVVQPETVMALQNAADQVYVDRSVMEYAVNLVLATRSPENFNLADIIPYLEFGASPRASIGLVRASRAMALLRGRSYVIPQDTFDVAPEVLRHRLVLSYEALAAGIDAEAILARLLTTVAAPRVTPTQAQQSDAWYGAPTDASAWAGQP